MLVPVQNLCKYALQATDRPITTRIIIMYYYHVGCYYIFGRIKSLGKSKFWMGQANEWTNERKSNFISSLAVTLLLLLFAVFVVIGSLARALICMKISRFSHSHTILTIQWRTFSFFFLGLLLENPINGKGMRFVLHSLLSAVCWINKTFVHRF